MVQPLMPKATAVWLVENTTLTFEQIADFCGLHALEVQGIADDEVAIGIVGLDPVSNGQLTRDELERCGTDSGARLRLADTGVPRPRARAKGARYTPLSKRQDRPDAINWLLKFHPEVSDAQIAKLLGTTKATINAVRDGTHWNTSNIKPQDPVSLGICTQAELDEAVIKAQAALRAREERDAKKLARAERAAAAKAAKAAEAADEADAAAGEAETEAETVATTEAKAEGAVDAAEAEAETVAATEGEAATEADAASAKEEPADEADAETTTAPSPETTAAAEASPEKAQAEPPAVEAAPHEEAESSEAGPPALEATADVAAEAAEAAEAAAASEPVRERETGAPPSPAAPESE